MTKTKSILRLVATMLLGAVAGSAEVPAVADANATPSASSAEVSVPPPTGMIAAAAIEAPQPNLREVEKQEQSQRALGMIPQFSVTSRHDAAPLTSSEKFHLALKSSTDPFVFTAVGLQASLSQAQGEFPEYKQGVLGYSRRYGAAMGDQVSSNFLSNYAFPVLFKEDPRYFRLGEGTMEHRIAYALGQQFVAHTDAGGRSVNWANIAGAFSSGFLSNTYYPPAERGVGLTMSRSAISLLYGATGNVFSEVIPDIQRLLVRRSSAR